MEQDKAQVVEKEKATPFTFFAVCTLILAVIGIAVSGLGILGLLNCPQVEFLSHKNSLLFTSFGGACGLIFLVVGLICSTKAETALPTQQIGSRRFVIRRGAHELRLLTARFQQRIDLLNALTKQQKFDCLETGQWALHEDEKGEHYILSKFSYRVNNDEDKRCRVRLKVLPMCEEPTTTNLYYSRKNRRLMLFLDGELVPFRGTVANNYLMQKAWVFSGNNFESMVSA